MDNTKATNNREPEKGNARRKRYKEIVVPVIEEQLKVDKTRVEKATVKVKKEVSEEIVNLSIPLQQENIRVQRIPKNQYVEVAPPPVRQEGDTTIISVLKEVVEKRTILVEEVHVKKEISNSETIIQESLLKEEVKIDRAPIRTDKHSEDKGGKNV